MSEWDVFGDISSISEWLDREHAGRGGDHTSAIRVMKISEEAGEAVAAYLGYTSMNPRKGHTHTLPHLLEELADVAITALVAIHHFTNDTDVTRAILAGKVIVILDRAGIRDDS